MNLIKANPRLFLNAFAALVGLVIVGLKSFASYEVPVEFTVALNAAAVALASLMVGDTIKDREVSRAAERGMARLKVLLLVSFVGLVGLVAIPLTGCAGGVLLNNPALTAVVDKAMAWIGLIDSVVSTLLKDPNVPPDWAGKYEQLRVKFAQAAVVVSNLVAEGEQSHQATLTAIEQLEGIGREIVALLQSVQVTSRSADSVAIPEPRFK